MNVLFNIAESEQVLTLIPMNIPVGTSIIGSQFDDGKQMLEFTRPDGYEDDDLLLFFEVEDGENVYNWQQNIEQMDSFVLPRSHTQWLELSLQVAFTYNNPDTGEAVTTEASQKFMLRFRKSIEVAGVAPQPPIQIWDNSFFHAESEKEESVVTIKFRNYLGEEVGEVYFEVTGDAPESGIPDTIKNVPQSRVHGNWVEAPTLQSVESMVLQAVEDAETYTNAQTLILGARIDSATALDPDPTNILERKEEGLFVPPAQRGPQGFLFTPSVSSESIISWTNDGNLPNPTPVNIKGAKGDRGDDGTGVTILGSYETLAELQAAHPTGNPGDAYLVGPDLYVWSESANSWMNVGTIKGPQGDKGLDGTDGHDGATFTPAIDSNGDVSWTNNRGLPNPTTQNVRGPKGTDGTDGINGTDGHDGTNGTNGLDGIDGLDGTTFIPSVSATGDLSWSNTDGKTNPTTVNVKGPAGADGTDGAKGDTGPAGVGIATGGTTNQVLAKASNDDYDTKWVNAGGEGSGDVQSVNTIEPDVNGNVQVSVEISKSAYNSLTSTQKMNGTMYFVYDN